MSMQQNNEVWDFSVLDDHKNSENQGAEGIGNTTQWDFSALKKDEKSSAQIAADNINYSGKYSQQEISDARKNARILGANFEDTLNHGVSAQKIAEQVAPTDLQDYNSRFLESLASNGKVTWAARQDLPALNMLAQALDEAEWPYAQPQFPQQAQQPQGPQIFATPTSGLERMGIRIQEGTRELGDSMANSVLGMVEGYAKHLRRGMEADQLAASPQGQGWLETIGRAITDSAQPVSQPDTQTAQGMRAALVPVLENFAQNFRSNMDAQQNTRNAPLAPAQNAVQRYTEDVVKMAPQMAAQALAFAGFGGMASTLFMGAQIGGQAYDEMRDKGVDADTALVASLVDAALQAPLEQLGLEKALSVFKTSGVWNAVKAIAGAAGTEFLTEWAQQYPDEIAHIWAETTQKGQGFEQGFKTFVDRLGEMTLEGMYQGAVAAPWGALFGGVGMVRNGKATAPQLSPDMQQFFTQQAQEANTMLARQGLTVALDAAAQHVDNLETRRQGPEALAEMLGELLPENFKQTWLGPDDARTLYQDAQENGQEAELLDALGTDAETVQQAVETGQPLPVDTAAVLAKAQPEARTQIMQAMRVTPDGASGTEAAQFDPAKRTQEAVRRVVEGAESANPNDPDAVLAQARSAQKLHAEVNKQTTRLAQQIESVGYPRHVAKANAELLAQNALAMQAAYGLPADETLRQVSYTRAENTDQQEGVHYQLDDNGNAVSPGEESPRIAPVVSVDPSVIVDDSGKPVDLKDNEALLAWLRAWFQGKSVTITDDGQKVEFTRRGMDSSLKRRGPEQRQAYAELDNLVSSALYDDFEEADERHKDKVSGQNVYYSAAKIGDNYFTVRIKVDMPARVTGRAAYKDHKVTEIEIAPSLYRGRSPQVGSTQDESAIRGISLSVLKGDVKPSRIEAGTLFQHDGKSPLGSVTFTPQSAAVRIFPGANLSTIPHESGHIFFENLIRIAGDDGSIALRSLQNRMANTLLGKDFEVSKTINGLMAQALKAKSEQRGAALHTLAAELRNAAKQAKETSAKLGEDIAAMKQEAKDQGKEYAGGADSGPWLESQMKQYYTDSDARTLAAAERVVKTAIKHLRGLDQAREDLHTLRQFAGIADDADITPGTENYTKLHEATARAFEQYLMEGNAPSPQLKGVLSRMRAWLLDIYKQARDVLGLPITDPVRRVFDRMLATDQQIRQSRQMQNVFAFERNFVDQHATTIDALNELDDLRNAAEREIQAVMDRATLKDRNKRYKEYYAAALDALDASPWWQMVGDLAARRRDDSGNSFGGLDRDSMARYIGAEMTAELSKARPGLINAQGNGLPVDVAAQEYGYEDGDTLAAELYDSLVGRRETKKGLAKSQADQAMQSEDATAEQDAMLAGGEAYAEYLDRVDEEVLRKAAQKGYRTVEEQERFVRNSITPRVRIKNQAFNIIQNTPLREITPARYQAMLDKALRDRQTALLDSNLMQAVNAVENARVANELIWASQYQLRQRDALLQLAGETGAAKPGTFPSVHTAALRKLLNQYGLASVRGLADPEFAAYSLRDLVQQTIPQDVVDVMPSFAGWLLNARDPKTGQPLLNGYQKFSDLTPNQLQEVDNLLKYLRKTGYDARTDAKNSEAAKIMLQVNAAVSAMQPLKDMNYAAEDTTRATAQEGTRKMSAAVDALRWQFRKADGFANIMGEAEAGNMEKLHDQILTGEQRKRTRIDDISTQMAPHLAHLWESVQAWEKKYGKNLMVKDANGQIVQVPEAITKAYKKRKTWTADMVIAVALNCGNASNMARLTSGYDLKYEMLAPLLGDQMAARIMSAGQDYTMRAQGNRQGLLSVADWQAIQGIWDVLHTQWADTQAAHERKNGFKPQGVEPTPLIITDPETGQVASLRGGYYPVRYDPKVSDKVAAWGEQEDIMSRNESMFAVPAAKKGHTQARTDRAPGLPLRLDTGLIMEHIQDVVSFIELGEIVSRADRITQNPQFRAEYVRAFGQADYDAIRPNLRGLVRKEPPPKSDTVALAANFMRKYLVPWGLSFNLKVAALQMTAVFPAMGDIGAKYVLHGMGYMTANRMQALRQIWEASPYMKSRMDNIDQDLQRNIANFSPSKREKSITIAGKEISWEDVVNAGMWPIGAVDAVATSAVWIGAYNKKLSQLQGEKVKYGLHTDSEFHQQAVDYADSMVKQSNPDFDPSSRSGFLRAQNSYRLVNNFASAITLFAARHKYMYTAHAKGKISLGQLARFEAYETLIPAAGMYLMYVLARGYYSGDDKDKKELVKLAMTTFMDQATMRVPMFGNTVGDGLLAAMGMDEGSRNAGGGIRTALDEGVNLFKNITSKGGRAVWHGVKNDEQAKALIYAAGDIASFIARVPVSKLIRAGERGYNQWDRGEGTPLSIIMPRPGK